MIDARPQSPLYHLGAMSRWRRILAVVGALAIVGVLPAHALASTTEQSMLLDDDQLIYSSTNHMVQTLQTLHTLGVDVVKVSVVWQLIAPNANSTRARPQFRRHQPRRVPARGVEPLGHARRDRPAARDEGVLPGDRPRARVGRPARQPDQPGAVARLDAQPEPTTATSSRRSGVVTAARTPTRPRRRRAPACRRWEASPSRPPHSPAPRSTRPPRAPAPPRRSRASAHWGIWNEPNERSWMVPWYRQAGRRRVLIQPQEYRALVDAAWQGLQASSHTSDTILVGETANRGIMSPVPFMRALYCVGCEPAAAERNRSRRRRLPQLELELRLAAPGPVQRRLRAPPVRVRGGPEPPGPRAGLHHALQHAFVRADAEPRSSPPTGSIRVAASPCT